MGARRYDMAFAWHHETRAGGNTSMHLASGGERRPTAVVSSARIRGFPSLDRAVIDRRFLHTFSRTSTRHSCRPLHDGDGAVLLGARDRWKIFEPFLPGADGGVVPLRSPYAVHGGAAGTARGNAAAANRPALGPVGTRPTTDGFDDLQLRRAEFS